jgi:uncharacterized protein (TIGR02145 family)
MNKVKKIQLVLFSAISCVVLLGCSDFGDRDNPLDPGASNYVAESLTESSSSIKISSSSDVSSGNVTDSIVSSSSNLLGNSSSLITEVTSSGSVDTVLSSGIDVSSSSQVLELESSSSEISQGINSSSGVLSSSSFGLSSSSVVVSSSSVAVWVCGDSTVSRGGVEYKTVLINEQCWTKENMKYEPSTGTTMCYDNLESNCETYGRLYDYEAAALACPSGFRLPTQEEMIAMQEYSGADMYDAGKHLKTTTGWTGENGDDFLGFSALPGGRCNEEQTCSNIGATGYWWTSTEKVKNSNHYTLFLTGDTDSFSASTTMDNDQYISVRCVKK